MPEPDWEPRAHTFALELTADINREFQNRNLLQLTEEGRYVVQLAVAKAVLVGIQAGIEGTFGTVTMPAPMLESCQVCGGKPVVVRWFTTEGPMNLCPECDARRRQKRAK